MVDQPMVSLRHISVVLVSPTPIDPQSIRHESLGNVGIVLPEWGLPTGGVNTPVVAQTQYKNGISLQVDGNRCVFQEMVNGKVRDSYEVHELAKRYSEATKLVPYSAIGLNWMVTAITEDHGQWIRENIMGDGGKFSRFRPTLVRLERQLGFVVCNLNIRSENDQILVDCNYHFQLARSNPDVTSSTLDSWERCQEHLKREIIPLLEE